MKPETSLSNLIEALQILLKYDNPLWPFHCEHDVLYINVDPKKVSKEDVKTLDEFGIFPDEENEDGFMSYAYGSS